MNSKILIIYTGGTIGMIKDQKSDTLIPFSIDNMMQYIPELKRLNCEYEIISFNPAIDSSNININDWETIALHINNNYKKFDGFVILHGTDTMAYTASALSFMLENLNKPVILTGSQLPVGTIRTDGKENIITAIEIAGAKYGNHAIIPEVCIYFENHLYRGNRTQKYNAEYFKAFRSPNYPPLADVGININYNKNAIQKNTDRKLLVRTKMDTNIITIHLFPGITQNYLKQVLKTENLKAVIIKSYGSGTTLVSDWFKKAINKTIEAGIPIFNVSQCAEGSIDQSRYANSKWLEDAGVVSGDDITIEAAITKLMYLLTKNLEFDELCYYAGISIRGEMSK